MTLATLNSRKKVSISSKRQITIPQAFFSALGFKDEAEFIFKENELVLRPTCSSIPDDFSEQILEELIKEGYSGKEMLKEFKIRQAKTKSAIKRMLVEADEVSKDKKEFVTLDELFKDK